MVGFWSRAAFFLGLFASAVSPASAETLALTGGSVYASPDAAPLPGAVILVSDGTISAIGRTSEVPIPKDARIIDCSGKTIVAGFWNSHVHFTQAVWASAAGGPAAPLTAHMQEMLSKWGFTTVWDLGSDPQTSLPLRRRVNAGEVLGPNIFFAGSMYPKDGHPIYIPAEIPLPETDMPDQAAKWARSYLEMGLDGVKLFTGSYKGEDKPVVNMEVAVAKAATDVAHARGKPVFAHPQNRTGVEVIIAAGVDVMAHTIPMAGPGYTPEELARFKKQNTALTPTLSLFAKLPVPAFMAERMINDSVGQLKSFSDNDGGPVLFGTDVGFTTIYDTTLEYELMHRALSERQVLASLTTNPAAYFKSTKKGKLEQGFDADIVVLDGDPLTDVRNLAKVATTIRAGQVIYQKP